MSKTILVVDDEKTIANNIKEYFTNKDYDVICAYDGICALDIFNTTNIDLIILDLMLPNISGEEICKTIRKDSNVPIIMLTAKIQENDKINGLEIGADIYVTKPFSLRELLTITNSLFRRVDNFKESNYVAFNNNDLKINYNEHKVLKNDIEVKLTKSERNILFSLSKFSNKVFTREELIKIALGDEFDGYDRAIDSHIKNLRSKIEDDTTNPVYVVTVRGVGYKFGD